MPLTAVRFGHKQLVNEHPTSAADAPWAANDDLAVWLAQQQRQGCDRTRTARSLVIVRVQETRDRLAMLRERMKRYNDL